MADRVFRDNVVIVTGASSGIGRALALQLADQKARLTLAARRAEQLEGVAQECRRRGGEALVVPTDVAEQEQCRRLIEQTVERYERIDTLINNAGVNMTTRFVELRDLSVFEYVMAVNFFGQLYATHAALPYLKATHGRIVTVCSFKSFFVNARADAYTASKHALVGFFGSLRIELAGTGVTVTLAYPPWVATELRTRSLLRRGGQALGWRLASRAGSHVTRRLRPADPERRGSAQARDGHVATGQARTLAGARRPQRSRSSGREGDRA